MNGIFHGDSKGCSQTCTKEPSCLDTAGNTQACSAFCGDGNLDLGEECDDANSTSGDGCAAGCKVEDGFTCTPTTVLDNTSCLSGSVSCLRLPVIYRDFQPENVSGGHPDFFFLGTRYNGSKSPTTICVPNSSGPGKGNDSTKRCWGIVGDKLSKGKPQPGATKTCDCQFSDWSVANSSRIPGGYTAAGNDSPLSDGSGGFLGGTSGTAVATESSAGKWIGTLMKYTQSAGYLEMSPIRQLTNGTTVYQYASKTSISSKSYARVGFYPLDTLNPSQATLCNLWPYWNHGTGQPIWSTCAGDQYLFPPRVTAVDCASGDTVDDGCWVLGLQGQKHNSYFTAETRTTFAYDGSTGVTLSFATSHDLFVFVNGTLVLDLGGTHLLLPGTVTISGNPGDAQVIEGGCLDATGNVTGNQAGSVACAPANMNPKPTAAEGADFRNRKVPLGLQTGKVYEVAIFLANRNPFDSDLTLTFGGLAQSKRSVCVPK